MPLSAGDKLGPYEILSPIGAGGMGEVWKARDTRLDRIVAIKQLKGRHTARFAQEARAIAALNHPHVCQIYDIGPDYLVLEYIDGRPLTGPLPLADVLRAAGQITDALELAHLRRIIHRDLKPANILLTGNGSAKLLDFGLAKLVAAEDSDATQTTEGAVLGTAAYMAPEQAEGRPLDERSDIFSLGAVLYEVISGTRAFPGDSVAQVLSSVLRDNPPALQTTADLEADCQKVPGQTARGPVSDRGQPEDRIGTGRVAGHAEAAVHSRAALREHERRQRAGVLQRRSGGGDHQRTRTDSGTQSDSPDFGILL